MNDTTLTQSLWTHHTEIYEKILRHPFIGGVAKDGSLPKDIFAGFLVQDVQYLAYFADALAIAAMKAPPAYRSRLRERAKETWDFERASLEEELGRWGKTEADVLDVGLWPTTYAYGTHLLTVAHTRNFHEIIGAVLPCYMIYLEMSNALLPGMATTNRYRPWAELNPGEWFQTIVSDMRALADDLGSTLTSSDRDAIERQFLTSSRYEWMMFEMAYKATSWPV